jgi:hypothetical protein
MLNQLKSRFIGKILILPNTNVSVEIVVFGIRYKKCFIVCCSAFVPGLNAIIEFFIFFGGGLENCNLVSVSMKRFFGF